ncbi:OmpA/MotB family protein [Saccharibacillus alkalitolerans]|uniref:OmpA family protein n=1 Tax=Saccharibacillus alkalitolerans TaxID=2705290 RepID=A0ABX0F218_9BACL|nr:OmpA family protein [Saccharibacillus alkalitolerans]NGZ74079.1 OmpA family protein [Saccharibacillus alkalitolerans]
MARGFRNERHVARAHEGEKESFWVSYTDLMSALLVIFALVIMITLAQSQSAYEAKAAAINEKNQIIEEAAGVKSEIIEALVKSFQDSDLAMEVDPQTGSIRFSGGVFFESNSSEVSATGRKYLKQFIPQYIEILLSDRFKGEIAQIIVEGHTDTKGGYLYNLKLSQDRALSVVQEIYQPTFPNFKYKEELKPVITANGRSFSIPILKANGKIDADKSRRVEFKFRLKDDQLLDQLQGLGEPDGN